MGFKLSLAEALRAAQESLDELKRVGAPASESVKKPAPPLFRIIDGGRKT